MNIDDVREWDAADLEQRFDLLHDHQDRLVSLQDELAGARNPEGWTGEASGATTTDPLDVPDGHAYTLENRGDPVADFSQFGADPNQMDGMTGLSAEAERTPEG